jgi:hypothetical protein
LTSRDQQLRSLARDSIVNPDSIELVDQLAWSMIRHGQYLKALRRILGARTRFETQSFNQLCGQYNESFFEEFIVELMNTKALREDRSRVGFIEAMVELLGSDENRLAKDKSNSFIKDLLKSQKIELISSSRLVTTLSRARSSVDPPRKGFLRLIYLMVLREALPKGEKLSVNEFDMILGRGQLGIEQLFHCQWRYDYNHLRRYLVQFGMVMRTPNGQEYWRSQKCLDSITFTKDAKELVCDWWRSKFR